MNKTYICLAIVLTFVLGCKFQGGKPKSYELAEPAVWTAVDGDVLTNMEKTRVVLRDMGFRLEKYDIESGYLRTYPTGASQFFELWKRDNVGAFNFAMANTNSIARIVELEFKNQNDTQIKCEAFVKRLSIQRDEAVSVTDMEQAFTETSGGYAMLSVDPDDAMWLNLGRDTALEQTILDKIKR